jgi:hypothetical protein
MAIVGEQAERRQHLLRNIRSALVAGGDNQVTNPEIAVKERLHIAKTCTAQQRFELGLGEALAPHADQHDQRQERREQGPVVVVIEQSFADEKRPLWTQVLARVGENRLLPLCIPVCEHASEQDRIRGLELAGKLSKQVSRQRADTIRNTPTGDELVRETACLGLVDDGDLEMWNGRGQVRGDSTTSTTKIDQGRD